MPKKNAQSTESNDSTTSSDTKPEQVASQKEVIYVSKNNYLINILLFGVAILIGIFIQYNHNILANQQEKVLPHDQVSHENLLNSEAKPVRTSDAPAPFDMDAVYREMSERLKKEIMDSLQTTTPTPVLTTLAAPLSKEDRIVNENKPNTQIDTNQVKEERSEIKFTKTSEPIVLENLEDKNKKKKEEEEEEMRREKPRQEKQRKKKEEKSPDEFQANKISQMKPKKMWIPIPNSNGGHRRVPAIEIKPGKEHASSVKVWLYEEFFSPEECENLIKVHEAHLTELLKQKPIICFDSVRTLRKNLVELKKEKVAELVTPLDFTEGTMCLNQTFSRQLEKWGLKWSFSTAFYPGESKFATVFGKRIEEATQLNETHGGKFQITSYPYQVGYKEHTDCVIDGSDERDRYATFLVYLNDMGADGGGQTLFPELGIDVKPRQARALTWNSMNYETGKCEAKSAHSATKVEHETKKKYVIQRWYYLKNFYTLGKRTPEAPLPQRPPNTPKVTCDDYDFGSCRLYDEWNPDHMLEYRNSAKHF